jgi:hypothetical protein
VILVGAFLVGALLEAVIRDEWVYKVIASDGNWKP